MLAHLSTEAVLCLDGTYGLNDRKFPVIVYGVTDENHSFHLVAAFLVSREVADIYKVTMRAIIAIASHVCGIAVEPTLILADGARSITRAITEV